MSDKLSAEHPHIAPGAATQPPATILIDQAAVPAPAEIGAAADSSPPGAWQLFLSSGSGRAGLVLFALMLLVSLWVLITYPLNFGSARSTRLSSSP